MKIILGKLKGRNFYMPRDIRPTQNIVKKAVFDLIGHDLSGLDILELFAGSGAIGLEAVSLGARSVTWVEVETRCADVIDDNLRLLGIKSYENPDPLFQVIQADSFAAIKQLSRLGKKYHLVFLDPPYGSGLAKKALKTLEAHDILHPDYFLIVQYDKWEKETEEELQGFTLITRRKYGSSFLAVYQKNKNPASGTG